MEDLTPIPGPQSPLALAAVHADLAKRLSELEQKTEGLALTHDTFSRNTRIQLKQLIEAVNQLMTPPDPPKRPIGFINPEDKANNKAQFALSSDRLTPPQPWRGRLQA